MIYGAFHKQKYYDGTFPNLVHFYTSYKFAAIAKKALTSNTCHHILNSIELNKLSTAIISCLIIRLVQKQTDTDSQ